MDPSVAELNSVTLFEIFPRTIEDNFFLATPLLAYWRDHCLVPFEGGTYMQAPIRYAPMIGGFYAPGSGFNISKRQTITAIQFDTRYLYVSIPEYKEEIQVENKGELAVASLLDADMQNGVDTINAIITVNSNLNGQTAGRTIAINGWPEAINDGLNPSYDGNVYTSYGQQARNGAIGAALNSTPIWCGDAAGNTGVASYNTHEKAHHNGRTGKK